MLWNVDWGTLRLQLKRKRPNYRELGLDDLGKYETVKDTSVRMEELNQ